MKSLDLEKLQDLSDEEADDLLHTWELWARPNQLEPPSVMENGQVWTTWLILAGRGFGKTRTGAETVIKWVREGTCKRIALVAEDSADARDVMVEGESGILACSPRDFKPKYEPSKRRLTWPNGAVATLFSAEDYDSLRGPQFDGAWLDELCKWRYATEAWDNLQFGLRLGEHPRQIVTTTPRPQKLLKDIILRTDTYITKGSTRDNLANLATPFKKAVIEKYENTRIGRQELEAELLDDTPGALWNRDIIDRARIKPVDPLTPITLPDFRRIVVSVDPPASQGENAAECGIMVTGIDQRGHGYVLEDVSMMGSPEEWGKVAVQVFDEWEADLLVYEANQGGEMVAAVLRGAARHLKETNERTADFVPLKAVHATRGKYIRAEPVSQLYEQGKIHHVGSFPNLEDQMCEFTPDGNMGYSPDRLDAMVWGFTELMVGAISYEGLMDYMRAESKAVTERLKGVTADKALPGAVVSLQGPQGINQAFGISGRQYLLTKAGNFEVDEEDVAGLQNAGFRRVFVETEA
jgi:phage terminase large subunit-like protein